MIFLDTHIVVWLYAGDVKRLSITAIELIENNDLYISQVVRLEMQYLFEIKRITATPQSIIKHLNQSIGLKVTSVQSDQLFEQAMQYSWTKDFFDRLITAEASVSSELLVTKDKNIRTNYTKAVW